MSRLALSSIFMYPKGFSLFLLFFSLGLAYDQMDICMTGILVIQFNILKSECY